MTADFATPQAVQDFLNERRALFRAFEFDHSRGVSANEIARMAAPAVSRPIVLAYLNARQLRTDVHRILRSTGLDGTFGVEIVSEIGRGARAVYLTLVVDPQEIERNQGTLVKDLTDALRTEGIGLETPERGSAGKVLWDGELVQLRRS